ncbi:MAG: hypothetical protein KDK96_04865 [Chlamydiia bacterium]|nr:hypothetical protein [Chlamydiia bacterium]
MSAPITTSNPWEAQWQYERHHIDELMAHHKVGEALQYIFASLLTCIGEFIEGYRMHRQAEIMNALKIIQQDRNTILDDFNQFKDSSTGESVAADAVGVYQTMMHYISNFEKMGYFSDTFIEGFEDHFYNTKNPAATIFQDATLDGSNVYTHWHDAWANAGHIPNDGGFLGIINNQFNEAKTTSQSSVVQAKLNYWSKQDSTTKAMIHMGFSALNSVEKTANNNIGK